MARYESKQQQILRPASQIYSTVEKFSNFTPIFESKVENWKADDDTCSFTAKGMNFTMKIVDRQQDKLIKVMPGDGGVPFQFSFWLQLKQIDSNDTRMRLVLDVELNMMLKMMVGGKLQGAIDKIAEGFATAFNNPNPEAWNF